MKRTTVMISGAVAAALLASLSSGCASKPKPSATVTRTPTTPTATASRTASRPPATVATRSGKYGQILTDTQGRTLYLFEADTSGKSTCSGACAAAWPPLLTSGMPMAGQGAKADLLGTTPRSDGRSQVTYHGHPLYRFLGDKNPGDTAGQGLTAFGAAWYVVNTSGDKVEG